MLKTALAQKRFTSLVSAYKSGKLDMSMISPALAAKIKSASKGVKVQVSKDMAKKAEAESKSQQRFFGMVSAYKAGNLDTSKMSSKFVKKIKSAAGGMTNNQVDDFAETKHKGLPEKVASEKTAAVGSTWYSWLERDYFPMFGQYSNRIYEAQKNRRVRPDWQKDRFTTIGNPCEQTESAPRRAPALIMAINRLGR